jgi:hypothetical protein
MLPSQWQLLRLLLLLLLLLLLCRSASKRAVPSGDEPVGIFSLTCLLLLLWLLLLPLPPHQPAPKIPRWASSSP